MQKQIPEVFIVSMEATYLLWLDCGQIAEDAEELAQEIRNTTGLYLTAGNEYGETGKKFLRMNVACSKESLQDGLNRLEKGIREYQCQKHA